MFHSRCRNGDKPAAFDEIRINFCCQQSTNVRPPVVVSEQNSSVLFDRREIKQWIVQFAKRLDETAQLFHARQPSIAMLSA